MLLDPGRLIETQFSQENQMDKKKKNSDNKK